MVGVAGSAHINAMNDGDAMEIYQPAQSADMPDIVVLVKSAGAPYGLTPKSAESLNPQAVSRDYLVEVRVPQRH